MTNEQARLKVRLDTAINAMRELIIGQNLPLETRIALAIADARLRDELARLEATIAKG